MVAGLATAGFGASADTELKAIEQQWLDAYMKGDAAFIKNVEADEYTIVGPDGAVTTKAEDVKSVTDKKFVLKSATMSDYKCRMLGDSHAVVTAALKMSGSDDGKEFAGDYRGLDVFEKKDGKWMAVSSQLTKVHKEKE
jgi:ketosteroid isomerase-like protein